MTIMIFPVYPKRLNGFKRYVETKRTFTFVTRRFSNFGQTTITVHSIKKNTKGNIVLDVIIESVTMRYYDDRKEYSWRDELKVIIINHMARMLETYYHLTLPYIHVVVKNKPADITKIIKKGVKK